MTDAQRDWAAELKAVIAEMREVVRLRKLFGEQEASLALWADRLSALAEAAPGEAAAWQFRSKDQSQMSLLRKWSPVPAHVHPDDFKHYDQWEFRPLYASPPLAPERAESLKKAFDNLSKKRQKIGSVCDPECQGRCVVCPESVVGDAFGLLTQVIAAMQADKDHKR